ncbi:Alpha/Beta hydrolase protein [Lasiosphaeria hispida]|uniref:Carboxylic ester hydrolase n=1 Tax=Lasiosphaeria hispida TaxID=260671 RepID=A0AAJ0MIT5_9PEZI|nr:Alpha/Beta hydrolase protein [Lasiosphaeria hispida]
MDPAKFLRNRANMKLFYLLVLAGLAACQNSPTIKVRNGTYRGRHLPEFDQDYFLGIPFARSQLLRNPEPLAESWNGVRSAEWNGAVCYTVDKLVGQVTNVTGISEDCLNLNIIRPSRNSLFSAKFKEELLPVAVWLYGGGFADGFGADFNSNYSYIVQASVTQGMPIIAVTLNYRVGFLGFPGGKEAKAAGITNLGLKDQRQALRWIKENIAAFGGDPNKITLWGQSAGAQSVSYQLLAYGGKSVERLFRGGIMTSGSVGIGNTWRADDDRQVGNYRSLLNITGCLDAAGDSLNCVRRIPIAELWEKSNRVGGIFTWHPTIDDEFIAKSPTAQLLAGEFPRDGVTLLAGTNSEEGFAYAEALTASTQNGLQTEEELRQALKALFPLARDEVVDLVLRTYPIDGPSPPYAWPTPDPRFCAGLEAAGMKCGAQYRRVAAIMGDWSLIHGRRAFAKMFAEHGIPFYSYRFDTWPTSIPVDVDDARRPGFAGHSTEYSYFFRYPRDYNLYDNNPPVAANSSAHLALSHQIPAKLIAYVYAGNPNAIEARNVPIWPKYTLEKPVNMVWNATQEPDTVNNHIESDTWREEGMALWPKYALELDMIPSRSGS